MRHSAYILVLGILFFGVARVLSAVGFWSVIGVTEPHGYVTQGMIFLALLFLLQNTVFDPILGVLEERDAQTRGKRSEAEKTRGEAEKKIAQYRDSIVAARHRAARERERQGIDGEEAERAVLRSAKERAGQDLKERVAEIHMNADRTRKELNPSVEALAGDMVAKIMNRSGEKRA
jgi:F0F1-type ATP synthase membrane subunit b/b'